MIKLKDVIKLYFEPVIWLWKKLRRKGDSDE